MTRPRDRHTLGKDRRNLAVAGGQSDFRHRLVTGRALHRLAIPGRTQVEEDRAVVLLWLQRRWPDAGRAMSSEFRLLMVGAMYENGGNMTHRFLDGHPELLVYPFESQLGTRLVADRLASVFPVKYRWPVFSLDANPQADYEAIIDEETRIRARTPGVSKFRHIEFDFSDDERCAAYVQY